MNLNLNHKILVTGGSGFLGGALIKKLLELGFTVVAFQRSKLNKTFYHPRLIEFTGDLSSKSDIESALANVDIVIHTASKVGMNGTFQDFYNINVTGTKHLIEAMKKQNIQRLIYTSTPSVVFGNKSLENVDESIAYPSTFYSHYAHTKKLAEEYVLSECNSHFFALALRPHLIFGPGDKNLIPRVIDAAQKGRLKIIGNGKNKVDVLFIDNAVTAHLLALSKIGPHLTKEVFFIGQGPVELWPFINQILALKKIPLVTKKIPAALAYFVGFIVELGLSLFQKHDIHPPMSRFIALSLSKSHYFNHQKSIEKLGPYNLVDLNEAIIQTSRNNDTGR